MGAGTSQQEEEAAQARAFFAEERKAELAAARAAEAASMERAGDVKIDVDDNSARESRTSNSSSSSSSHRSGAIANPIHKGQASQPQARPSKMAGYNAPSRHQPSEITPRAAAKQVRVITPPSRNRASDDEIESQSSSADDSVDGKRRKRAAVRKDTTFLSPQAPTSTPPRHVLVPSLPIPPSPQAGERERGDATKNAQQQDDKKSDANLKGPTAEVASSVRENKPELEHEERTARTNPGAPDRQPGLEEAAADAQQDLADLDTEYPGTLLPSPELIDLYKEVVQLEEAAAARAQARASNRPLPQWPSPGKEATNWSVAGALNDARIMDRYVRFSLHGLLAYLSRIDGRRAARSRELELYCGLLGGDYRLQLMLRVERILNRTGLSIYDSSPTLLRVKDLAALFKPVVAHDGKRSALEQLSRLANAEIGEPSGERGEARGK